MKKIAAIIVAVAVVMCASADTWTDPDTGYTWTYRLVSGGAEIYGNKPSTYYINDVEHKRYHPASQPTPTDFITIPSKLGDVPVVGIGDYAFAGCEGLTGVDVPYGVMLIGDRAFYKCGGLTRVNIPSSVMRIGISAFYNCDSLDSVTIPSSVTSIRSSAFFGCNGLTNVTFSGGAMSIEDGAFSNCQGLTEVTITNGVTSIGEQAFYNCKGLTSVTLGNSVTNIGESAFYNCGLTRVTIGDGVMSIGGGAFSGCSESLFDTTTMPGLKLVDGWVVGNTGSLSGNLDLTGVRGIADWAFSGCSGLTSVTIPESVAGIGFAAFSGCSGLEEITLPFVGARRGNTESADSLFGYIFGTLSYTGGMETRQHYFFNYSYSSSDYYIPSRLRKVVLTDETVIGYGAFYNCSGLTNITIPDSVTTIGDWAFYGTPFYDNQSDGLVVFGKVAYRMKGDCPAVVTIPSDVTSIGPSAFSGCTGLTSVTIPNSVSNIGESAFYYCINLKSVTIGSGATSIGYDAFYNCTNVVSLTAAYVPDSIERAKLTNVAIPIGVTNIGDFAFYNCGGVTNVTIPKGVTSIGNSAFSGCSGLTGVTIPESVTSIGDCAFYECSGLTSVTIPASVTSIGNLAFCNCSGLASLTIPNSVVSIGDYAFTGCSGLTSVMIPSSVTSIGYGVFEDDCNLMNMIFCGDMPSVHASFYDQSSGCKAYVKSTTSGWPAESEYWNGLEVVYYGGKSDKATIEESTNGYVLATNEGETLSESDITVTAFMGGALVNTTRGYDVKIATDGKSATARLKTPRFGAAALVAGDDPPETDSSDPTGTLVESDGVALSTQPWANDDEEIGALPVAAVPGLYYQAAWGDSLDNLTTGAKVQATTDTLYLGVIKQTGTSGFYKVTVSER